MKHKVISNPGEKPKTELVAHNTMRTQKYCSLEESLKVDIAPYIAPRRIKRTGAGYPILKTLQQFRNENNRDPLPSSRNEDIGKLLKIRDEIAPELVSNEAFDHVFAQISPAAAVVGGEIAQEIIKTVSQKEAPIHNFFIFDPERCSGYIELVEPTAA